MNTYYCCLLHSKGFGLIRPSLGFALLSDNDIDTKPQMLSNITSLRALFKFLIITNAIGVIILTSY
jgi:hypothetical protein